MLQNKEIETMPTWTNLEVDRIAISIDTYLVDDKIIYQPVLNMFVSYLEDQEPTPVVIATHVFEECKHCAIGKALSAIELLYPEAVVFTVFVFDIEGTLIEEIDLENWMEEHNEA